MGLRPGVFRVPRDGSVDADVFWKPNGENQVSATMGDADSNGFGASLQAGYAPGGALEQYLRQVWFDRNFNINDLGYMERNSLHQLVSTSTCGTVKTTGMNV